MKNIFITARYRDDEFDSFLGPSLNTIKTKCINVSDKPDSLETKTTTQKYNIGMGIAKTNNLLDNDTIVVFAKPNAHILDSYFVEKLEILFSEKPDVGVIGVVGVKELHSGRSLYNHDNSPVNGIVYKTKEVEGDKKGSGEHIQYSKKGFYDNIVAVDDSLIAVRGSFILDEDFEFDSITDKGFGVEASVKATLAGYTVGVADMLVLSGEDTNHDHEVIDDVVTDLKLSYPVNVKTLGECKQLNSVVDVEI